MKGPRYFKAEPTEYARVTTGGKVRKEGLGISKVYLPFRTSIERVSITDTATPFNFQEVTIDNQKVSLQGAVIYKVEDPGKLLRVYNFALDPYTREPLSDDESLLTERMQQKVRGYTRRVVEAMMLEPLLTFADQLASRVQESFASDESLKNIGIRVGDLFYSAVVPSDPKLAQALEAGLREKLLLRQDEAQYERRASAVAKERAIKEAEVRNSIELEQQRKELIGLEGTNLLAEAENERKALEEKLKPYQAFSPAQLTALGMLRIGENAQNIENLSITSEMLAALLQVKS
ncbi:hypothetical protein COV16_03240 [Candidatus Woesearchaeota archaeon CG10_big_fil_rev_8_21_14_0_10_34_8]|nr:MAG: hypothetical protein COV16_03240 [Candidatus Woesearchaeota archaeon CG10_big_fil_rev_8_21_14_0_10_34_8]